MNKFSHFQPKSAKSAKINSLKEFFYSKPCKAKTTTTTTKLIILNWITNNLLVVFHVHCPHFLIKATVFKCRINVFAHFFCFFCFHYKVNNLIMLVAHLWVYLFKRFHFHIKSIYFTFKKVACSDSTIFLFTETNVFYAHY